MITTMLVAAVDLSRMLLRRLLTGWVFALALRAEPCEKRRYGRIYEWRWHTGTKARLVCFD